MKTHLLLMVMCAGLAISGCGGGDGTDASNKTYHLCFFNNQGTAIYGIGYRESGTTDWHLIYFDSGVEQDEGFDYPEGVMEEEPPGDGVYDIMCFDEVGDPVKQWLEVAFAKADYGMVVNPDPGESTFGQVDTACNPSDTIYYNTEPSKCEANGGYCVEGAMCDTEHFPWYAWGCATSNCCLPEVSSCTGLGGQCMRIEDIQNCHDLGYKAANSLDCSGSALTTICCMPVD